MVRSETMKDYITVVDGKKRRIRNPSVCTDEIFEGHYKGFHVIVSKHRAGKYSVYAFNSEIPFGMAYDGYYTEDDHITRCIKNGEAITPLCIDHAIQDAIRSILI